MHRLSILAFILATPAFAQPPGRDAFDPATAAPFVDEHTLVVARVDLTRVDVETVLKLAHAVAGDEIGGQAADEVRAFVREFGRRGGTNVFLTYGPSDFPNLPCLIIPASAKPDDQKLLAQLFVDLYKLAGKPVDSVVLRDCICVGPKESVAVVKARKPVARPDLADALAAGADGVIQVAFAPSAEARKIHEQVAPTLPPELGGGGIQKITRGMKWMAVVVGPGPKMPAKWITECASPQAAGDLKNVEQRAQQALAAELLRAGGEPEPKRVHGLFDSAKTTTEGNRITTEWDLATDFLAAVKRPEGPPADRVRSANNLKQLMIALHNYHDTYGHFPVDIRDKDGKPLLSWRVEILPFIEQENLYKQFKLDEPWDGPNNRKLIDTIPRTLRSPRQAAALNNRTTYLAPLGKGFIWDSPKGIKISEITDGTSNTIMLVEADDDRAVIWSKPEDITIDRKNPENGLLGHYVDGFQAAMADGSVRFVRKGIDPAALWALFTRAGGEVVDR
jgi:hypothetical protein